MHSTPVPRRASTRRLFLAATVAALTATLTACGGGSTGPSTVAAAQSAAGQISHAVSSGAAAGASSDPASTGDDGSGSGSDGSSPCGLVSTQQLSSILHHDVTNASVVAGICFFTDGDAGDAYQVATFDDANCWSRATNSFGATPVPGVGDAAVGSPLGLEVKHGSTCLSVGGGTSAEQSGDFSADVAVAKIAVGKLG